MAVELWTNDAGCDLPCHYSVKRRIFQAFRPKKGRFSKCLSCGKAVDRNCGQVWKKRGDVERMWEKKTGRRERFRKKRKERGGRERLSTQISTMWIKLSPDIHLSTGKRVWRKQVFFHGKQEKIAGGRQRRGDFIRRTLEKRRKYAIMKVWIIDRISTGAGAFRGARGSVLRVPPPAPRIQRTL